MSFLRFFLLFLIIAKQAWSLDVVASINPVSQIISAIGIKSYLIVKPNQSEHDYRLKKSDISALIKSDLIFYVDDSLEKSFPKLIKNFHLEKKSYQLSKISGLQLLSRNNDPKKLDPHLWLDPENGIKIAKFIAQKFCESDVKNCPKYQSNFKKFRQETLKTKSAISSDLKGFDAKYVIYHDAYQYFEKSFGLKAQKVISHNHSDQLRASDLRGLELSKCIFSERMDERNAALKLAKNHQMKFIELDVVGTKGESYGDLLRNIAQGFSKCS